MFTDHTCFSSDLIDFCVKHGKLSMLMDCTDAKDVSEECAALANEMNRHAEIPRRVIVQVCDESGADWDTSALSQHEALVKAIFCSLPDTGSEEFLQEVIQSVFYEKRRKQNTSEWRQTVYQLLEVIDNI